VHVVEVERASRAEQHLRRWRYEYLRRAGWAHEPAEAAACDLGWDLNALLELVGRGCPPALALRILDPVDGKDGQRP
jgi:hypothetical protein